MSNNRKFSTFVCPQCGETVSRNARSCPRCGSDEETGWSELTYLDGVELPGEVEYDDAVRKEFPPAGKIWLRNGFYALVGAFLLVLFGMGLIRSLW